MSILVWLVFLGLLILPLSSLPLFFSDLRIGNYGAAIIMAILNIPLLAAFIFLTWLLLTTSASAESYEQKAKEVERKLDTVIIEGQKQIDYFDSVVLPWLDEYEKKRKQRSNDERVHPRRIFRGNSLGLDYRGY